MKSIGNYISTHLRYGAALTLIPVPGAPRLWANQTTYDITDLGSLGGSYSVAYGINDKGHAVGYNSTDSMAHLNNRLPAGSDWTSVGATVINDAGQIVGYGANPDGYEEPFPFAPVTPAPKPTAMLAGPLLLVPFGIGVWHRMRRCSRRP